MGELALARRGGAGIKYATGDMEGTGALTFSISGLGFQPTHCIVVAATNILGKDYAAVMVSSDGPFENGALRAFSWYSTYGGSRNATATFTSDGFSVSIGQDEFLKTITYKWFAWAD